MAPSKEGARYNGRQRPRETRSISDFTIRSTKAGRLSSSQDFSIGRSISLTRSSSVRALLLSTVLASALKADSTAFTVVRDRIGPCIGISTGDGPGIGGGGEALASGDSQTSCGAVLL